MPFRVKGSSFLDDKPRFVFSLVRPAGLEPTANWLKASCSTIELRTRVTDYLPVCNGIWFSPLRPTQAR